MSDEFGLEQENEDEHDGIQSGTEAVF